MREQMKRLYSCIVMRHPLFQEVGLVSHQHCGPRRNGGLVFDRWNAEKRHKVGRINIRDDKGSLSDVKVSDRKPSCSPMRSARSPGKWSAPIWRWPN